MTQRETKIIRLILKAQWANNKAHGGDKKLYSFKHQNVCLAIKLINNTAHCSIIYKIEEAPDQNGFPSTIYYFEWKEPALNGRRIQFSFHKPREKGGTHGVKSISWTKNKGECEKLYQKLEKVYF